MSPLRFAALAALGFSFTSSAQPASPPSQLTVTVWSYGFAPHPIHLAAGRPVTLTFANRSGGGHDFTAHEFFRAARILSGDAGDGEIELKGHETKSITLIPAPGNYHAHCGHFFHQTLGMSDEIIVD